MAQDTNVSNLIINKLTKQQYEGILSPSPTELYMVTDDSGITSSDVTTALGYTPENAANKVTSVSASSTDTQYPSAKLVYDQLALKQDTLVSGTNIKTVNNNSILGSGNIDIDALPSQTGNTGKFLTTDGSAASWATISFPTDPFPSQTGNSGKYLTTNGSEVSWAAVDSFPSQTGNTGKFLTTNGSAVSWATVDALPTQSGQSGKFLTTDGTDASWATVGTLPSQTGNSGKFLTTDGTDASWATVDVLPTQSGQSGKFLTTNGSVTSWAAVADMATVNKKIITQGITTITGGTVNLSYTSSIYAQAISSATTFTFNTSSLNLSSGIAYTFELMLTIATSTPPAMTFPSSVSWQDGVAPILGSPGLYFLVFRTTNGGTNWYGNLQGVW